MTPLRSSPPGAASRATTSTISSSRWAIDEAGSDHAGAHPQRVAVGRRRDGADARAYGLLGQPQERHGPVLSVVRRTGPAGRAGIDATPPPGLHSGRHG